MPFLEGLLEGPADGHGLAHRLHRRRQHVVGLREFLEGPARDLDDAVVDRRLERGVGLAGDVVSDLVEGVADGELGGDLGDREAGGLGGQGRGARHAGVHLDHHQFAVGRVDRELDVGAAGLDADLADDGDGRIAHLLVLAVGQGLGRGDGDGVAGVDAHGIHVLDRADDDDVVVLVAHDLELELLPAEQAALEHDLGGHRQVEPGAAEVLQLLAVVGDAAAGAAEGEARADDDRKADGVGGRHRRLEGVDDGRFRHLEADGLHRRPELLASFRLLDDVDVGGEQFDPVLFEGPGLGDLDRGVEGGLAAQGRQDGVGPLLLDDLGHHLRGDRLDVGGVGQLRVGHDGGRVGVDQHDLVAFFLQGLDAWAPE